MMFFKPISQRELAPADLYEIERQALKYHDQLISEANDPLCLKILIDYLVDIYRERLTDILMHQADIREFNNNRPTIGL